MIANRNYSFGTLSELDLDGYCDFGFPIGHIVAWEFSNRNELDHRSTKLDEVI